jgi:hypothetical protein
LSAVWDFALIYPVSDSLVAIPKGMSGSNGTSSVMVKQLFKGHAAFSFGKKLYRLCEKLLTGTF